MFVTARPLTATRTSSAEYVISSRGCLVPYKPARRFPRASPPMKLESTTVTEAMLLPNTSPDW